jgi:hypothetical protein
MSEERYEPTKAEILAGIVTGNAHFEQVGGAVQRSHRFPLHIFAQIENLARMADSSVSVIINQLLECGLEAVRKELPDDVAEQVSRVSREQMDRPVKQLKEKAGRYKVSETPRSKK